MSPLQAGLTYLPGMLLLFVASAVSAKLGERFSPSALLGAGLVTVAGGLALLTATGADSSWTATLPGILLASLGTGIFNPTLGALALGAGPPERSGLLSGINDMARQTGIAVGVGVFGALIPASAALGRGSPVAYVHGLHHALVLGSAIAASGAAATVALIGATRAARPTTGATDGPQPSREPA